MARVRRGQSKQTRTPGPQAAAEPAAQNDHRQAGTVETDRSRLVNELERDLDRILFRIMSEGGMPEIERQVRLCRRLLILGSPE
jgi:hypothetical protein